MLADRDLILERVANGELSAREGQRRLVRLPPHTARKWLWGILSLELLLPTWALILATLGAVIAVALAPLQVRFDGIIDVHVTNTTIPAVVAVVDQLIVWPVATLVLWGAGRLVGSKAPWRRYLAYGGAARLPLVCGGLLVAFVVHNPTGTQRWVGAPDSVMLVVVLPALAAFVLATLSAFRVASGLSGHRLLGGFLVGILTAGIVGELLLALVFSWA